MNEWTQMRKGRNECSCKRGEAVVAVKVSRWMEK